MLLSDSSRHARVGYVLKMYPRFSETFVVSEILAREAAGADIEIFSLRPPVDPHFHETLAAVRAPVTYLPSAARRAADLWELVRQTEHALPRLAGVLPDLVRAEVDDAAQALQLALLLRERGITHLHAHFASVATTVARLASKLTGVPYSFTAHAKDLFHDSVNPAELHDKLRDAHHVVTVSDYNLRFLREGFGPAPARVSRVYNGLDLSAFPYLAPSDRAPMVVGVGRLVEKKGFSVLVDACALLAAEGREFRCVLVGAGPLEEDLRHRVSRLGLDERVWLAGALPQGKVREIVSRAAAFAAPCVVGADGNKDGLPTVLLEAMALGTPCVSTDVTGIPELLRHEQTGLLVGQHDSRALARAVGRLLDNPALGRHLARAARALVEREFDSRHQARQLADLLTGTRDRRVRSEVA